MLSRLPFGIPSRSIGQLLGNRTFVGHVVPQFLVLLAGLKSLRFVMLDVSSQNPSITEISSRGREVLEFILLKHGGLWASSHRNTEFLELVLLEPEGFGVDPSETWRTALHVCLCSFRRRSMTRSSCSLPPLGRATLSVSRCLLTSMLLSASHWPRGLTLSSSAPPFLVVVSSSEVYQGGRAAVFSTLRQGFFAEQLQWNPTSTQRHSIHLAISIFRSSSSDSSCLEELMASRACYTWNQQEPKIIEACFEVGTRNQQEPKTVEPGAILPWRGVSSRVNHGSGEKKLFLAPRWLGLRDFAGIDLLMRIAPWVNAWLICPCFPHGRVFLRGISGYMARKSGSKVVRTLDPKPGSWDPEPGSWNPEPGSWNPEPRDLACPFGGRAAVFSTLRQGFFAEQLQWNPTSTERHSIHLAISIFRSSSSDSSCLEALMASRACYVAARTKDCRGLTCGLGQRPAGTEDCRAWCYPPLERCFQPGEPRICISRSSSSDSSCLEALMASRACYVAASVSSRVNRGSGEKKLFLPSRWLGLRDFAGIDVMSLPPITLSLYKPGDPALRILPYGYGPVYVVDALAVAGGLVVRQGPPIIEKIAGSS
ncbi:hypothetical protein F2Q69_00043073 [Brassica cretica]|uniref:Uncharacterized protein n=1 Tax=Brassica cretica TaxID=69181 RepID=A0A8S9NL27_BRACR|nr:hypothetical protein F2Q69_00043073 [Brassica cretica]